MYAGMAGVSDQAHMPVPLLVAAQLLWIAVPLLLAALCFRRKQL